MTEQELTFFKVFGDLQTPLGAIDVGHLNKALGAPTVQRDGSHIGLRLEAVPHKRAALIASFGGLLSGLNITPEFVRALEPERHLQRSGRGWMLKRQPIGHVARSGLTVVYKHLMWRSDSVWPMAYATWFGQLTNTLYLYKAILEDQLSTAGENLERKGFARENLSIFAEYPRNLPTSQHYAMAALGAWLGGAMNVQYFLYHATIKQIRDASVNDNQLKQMGMEADIAAIDSSGLIGVPERLYRSLVDAQGDQTVFGSLPLDEYNSSNPPATMGLEVEDSFGNPNNFSGVLVDKYYRMSFRAQNLDNRGVYGAANVLRDHYADFYRNLDAADQVRCKHYCAPVINVSSTQELIEILSHIPQRGDGGIFFRGQRKLHLIRRDPAVQRFLFSNSCSAEPSLITTAARERAYVYEEAHFALRRFLEQRIYAGDRASIAERTERWRAEASSPSCKLDYAVMALAQHYGIPTHGLDVTLRPEVAIWFATNVFDRNKTTGDFRYDPLQAADWPSNQEDYPIVVVCQAVTNTVAPSLIECQELAEFGFSAKRPQAQSARFFHGGHSDHQNRLAETVVCVFRLQPANYELDVSFKSLFPPPAEDPAYQLMLDFAETDHDRWAKYVTRFHPKV
ncbi:FRG domain-containing protein [Paraburkholderia mimosarum]|uniref:FRG domain-containing protein n=1 Tax=Paraburkholderia mimosarum TaxID=312026 RepID=UPI000ACB5779|nr:FRG domain-containing protein [Paraburkholderia mimosarum]